MVFYFDSTNTKTRIVPANTRHLTLLTTAERNEIMTTSVMIRRIKIIAPNSSKSKEETKEKSENNLTVPNRKKNELMDDNNLKELIAYMRKENECARKHKR